MHCRAETPFGMEADSTKLCTECGSRYLARVYGRAEAVAGIQHDVSPQHAPLPGEHVDLHLAAAGPEGAVHQLLLPCTTNQPGWEQAEQAIGFEP